MEIWKNWKKLLAESSGELPNPDITLQKEHANISIYKRLLYDSRVWSCLKKLLFYLNNFSFHVVTFEKDSEASKQAIFFEDMFENSNFREQFDFGAILTKFFGYTVTELIFEPKETLLGVKSVSVLPHEWFAFDLLGNLIYYPNDTMSYELVKVFNDPSKEFLERNKSYLEKFEAYQQKLREDPIYSHRLLVCRNNPSLQNPYGEGDASRLFYEVLYRNMAKKFRAFNAEKFGVPTLLLETNFDTSSEEGQIKARQLTNLITEYMGKGIIVKPIGTTVVPLIGVPTESRTLFDVQISDADQIIQDIILMQSGAQDLQAVGARAAVEVFEESAFRAVWACKRTIEHAANSIMKTVAQINGWQLKCYYELYNERELDLLDELELDKTLMDVSGLKFKKRYFIDKYSRNVNDFVPESLADETEQPDSSKTELNFEDLSNAESDTADE
jgi:hypothetical protein